MAGRENLSPYIDLPDFACDQVLTHTNLNNIIDNIKGLRQIGDTVFAQTAGKDGYQRTIVGFAPIYTSTILTAHNEQASAIWYQTMTEEFVFENPSFDKYVLNLKFRAIDSENDSDFGMDNVTQAEFTQKIIIKYKAGDGEFQTLFDSSDTSFGTYSYDTVYKPFLTGSLNDPPLNNTSQQVELHLIVQNTAVGGSIGSLLDNQPILIKDSSKWGGIASCSLRLHN